MSPGLREDGIPHGVPERHGQIATLMFGGVRERLFLLTVLAVDHPGQCTAQLPVKTGSVFSWNARRAFNASSVAKLMACARASASSACW